MTVNMACKAPRRARWAWGMFLLFWMLNALLFWAPVVALQQDLPPVEGTIVNIAEIGSDFFVQLDVDADGKGDVWAKILDTILDLEGNFLTTGDLSIGLKLRVLDYRESETGFIEAHTVVVLSPLGGSTVPAPSGPSAATNVNLFARTAGAPRPPVDLFATDTDAWVCLGESVVLYWVTTADVGLVSLGETLGVFPANQGGTVDGLNWGSVVTTPALTTSYVLKALDSTFNAGDAATVRVFGQPRDGEVLHIIPEEGTLEAKLGKNTGSNSGDVNTWTAATPSTRFSKRLELTDIEPVGAAAGLGSNWRVRKTDEDGAVHDFSIVSVETFQHPFRPEGSQENIPLSGTWRFSTQADVAANVVPFKLRPRCP